MQLDTGKKSLLKRDDYTLVKAECKLAGQLLGSQTLGKPASLCNLFLKPSGWSLKRCERALGSSNSGGSTQEREQPLGARGKKFHADPFPSISTKEKILNLPKERLWRTLIATWGKEWERGYCSRTRGRRNEGLYPKTQSCHTCLETEPYPK